MIDTSELRQKYNDFVKQVSEYYQISFSRTPTAKELQELSGLSIPELYKLVNDKKEM